MRRLITFVATGLLAFAAMGTASAEQNSVTPSTNEINATNGWAHFTVDSVGAGEATITFTQPNNWYACFEYRIDGAGPDYAIPNYNTDVTDGLWNYTCEKDSSTQMTLYAADKIEIRMVFGAETDERFDWTTVEVVSKDDCQAGAWETLGLKNQGQCVASVETNANASKG